MATEQIVVAVIIGALFVACLCAFCYLSGYEKALREELRFLEFLDRMEELKDGETD